MDLAAFCDQSRVVVVAGKGGVGKSTVAASLALLASEAGRSVLIVELEGKSAISAAFAAASPLAYEETELRPGSVSSAGDVLGAIRARRLTPDDALLEYLGDHGLQRVSKRLMSSGVIDVVATAIPGIKDVLLLGKVKQLERERSADLIIVDAPATGHAVTFLTSASGLLDVARSGPVRTQAADVVEFLSDPSRCRITLVTLPEEMPIKETVESAYLLEDRAGVTLGPVVVNGCLAVDAGLFGETRTAARAAGVSVDEATELALESARKFSVARHELQARQIENLSSELPLPELTLPLLAADSIGPDELRRLTDALIDGVARLRDEVAPR
jgi:anion-transporting  ArsA/GET3 family ATPase